MRLLTLVLALPFLLVGCGGRGGSHASAPADKVKGSAILTVRWPARVAARPIPNATNAISVVLIQGASVAARTIPRPTDGSASSSVTLTGLAYGTYRVTAQAYPSADGSGVAQATGGGSVTVAPNAPGAFIVALDSTVANLTLVPDGATARVGGSVGVAVAAKDATGATVLLSAGGGTESLAWTATPAGAATIVGTGPNVTVTGNAVGPVTLTGSLKTKDDGTTLSGTVALNVKGAPDYRLAVGAYPKTGGDAGNTGQGGGSGASGAVDWTAQVGQYAVAAVVVDVSGTVYTGSGGIVSAVSKEGKVLWQETVAGNVQGLLLTQGGQLLVSAAKLTSLDTDGSLNWTFPEGFGVSLGSGEALYAPAVLSDGTVVLATTAQVVALDPYAKSVKWSVASTSASAAAVAADDTVVVLNDEAAYGKVVGLVGASGAQAFVETPTPDYGSFPVPSKSTLGQSGTVRHSEGFYAPPCVLGNAVAYVEEIDVEVGTVAKEFTGSTGSFFYHLNITHTETPWLRVLSRGSVASTRLAHATSPGGAGAPALPETKALSEDASGRLLLTYSDKTLSSIGWGVAAPGSGGASICSDGTVYLATTDAAGLVEAIDPTTGAVRWTATLPAKGASLRPAIGTDGSLYAGTVDGRVVQIR